MENANSNHNEKHFTPSRLTDLCSFEWLPFRALGLLLARVGEVVLEEAGNWMPLPLGRLLPASWCPPWLCGDGEQSRSSPEAAVLGPPPVLPAYQCPLRALGSAETASLECAPVRALLPGSHMSLWLQGLGLVCRAGGQERGRRQWGGGAGIGSDCPSLTLG